MERVNVALGYVRSDIAQDVAVGGVGEGHEDNVEIYIGRKENIWVCGQHEGSSAQLTPACWPDRVWYCRAPRGAVLSKISSSKRHSPGVIWQNRFYRAPAPASWPRPGRLQRHCKFRTSAKWLEASPPPLVTTRSSPTIWPFLPVDEYLTARYVHPIPRQGETQLLRRT